MFVYSGIFSWNEYAKKETFVLVLPNGHVRAGDSVYLFSQWTEDDDGAHKKNWFDKLPIGEVKKSSNGDDIFTLEGSWYTAVITTQKAYDSLSVTISNRRLLIAKHKETFTAKRYWQPQDQHPTDDLRIWTGKINWREFAKNELAMFILPDGFGEGKPVLSLWQWTKSSSGELNNFQFREAAQKVLPSPGDGICKFSYQSYYDITCTWDKKTEKLSVNMKESSHSEDIGVMDLTAHVQRHSHHTFNPPKPTSVTKSEFEVSLPQAQPTLPRILTPLPFPDGILETLAQTVAFADHAGYLAKYAQDRFNTLDADLHKRIAEIATLNDAKNKLDQTAKDLTAKLDSEKTRATKLEQELSDAKAAAKRKEDELNKKYHELEDKTNKHDKHDHEVIQKAREDLKKATSKIHSLEEELAKARVEISVQQTQLKTAQAKIAKLNTDLHDVKAKYEVEKKANERLHAANVKLEREKHALEEKLKDLQSNLDQANKRYAESQDELKVKSDLLLKEQAKVKDVEKERDAALKAQKETADALKVSQLKVADLEKDLGDTKAKLEKSEAELQQTKDLLASAKKDVKERQRDVINAQNDAQADIKKAHDDAEIEATKFRKQISDLRADIAKNQTKATEKIQKYQDQRDEYEERLQKMGLKPGKDYPDYSEDA